MSDTKITQFDEATSALNTDIIPIVVDPSTTPITKKITKANFLSGHTHILAEGATDVTATVTEINYVDGVTSAIQTQLNTKAPMASPTFTGTVILPKTLEIQDTSADHQYVLAVSELTADRTITLPLLTASDEFVFKDYIQTLMNKRWTRRVLSTNVPGATPTLNTDNYDVAHFTGLNTAITSMTTNLTGTPVQGDVLRIDFTDDGTARAITFGASFEASGIVALPTTTVLGVRLDTIFVWNTVTSKWRIVGNA